MSHALEGTPKPAVTLTEQANGQRIGRSMFIGHTAGYVLLLAAAIAGLAFAGFTVPTSYDAVFAVTQPPTVLHFPFIGLHPYAVLGLSLVAMIVWTDLTVRRRHDRGRSGVDAADLADPAAWRRSSSTPSPTRPISWAASTRCWCSGRALPVLRPCHPPRESAAENRYGAVPRPD